MKKIIIVTLTVLALFISSCEQKRAEFPADYTKGTVHIDSTIDDSTIDKNTINGTTADDTTVPESTESSDIPETTAETITSEPVTSSDNLNGTEDYEASSDESTDTATVESEVKVYVDPIPWEPAIELRDAYRESRNITVYYHSGENCVKFELVCNGDKEDTILKINDNIVDLSETEDIGLEFSYIYIASEFIVTTSGTADDSGELMYIFDYSGKVLFHTYYLSNTGMFVLAIESVDDDKILIRGTRCEGFEFNVRPEMRMDHEVKLFSGKYSDRLYEGEKYEYGSDVPSLIYLLDISSLDDLRKLNPNEISYAVFELDYLGNGEFGNIEMTSEKTTIADEIDQIESNPELYDHSAVSEDDS